MTAVPPCLHDCDSAVFNAVAPNLIHIKFKLIEVLMKHFI